MINLICQTNIHCAKLLKWPTQLPARPQVGDLIRSTSSTNNKHIELAVVECTWVYSKDYGWQLEIDLHLPPHRFANIQDFEKFLYE